MFRINTHSTGTASYLKKKDAGGGVDSVVLTARVDRVSQMFQVARPSVRETWVPGASGVQKITLEE